MSSFVEAILKATAGLLVNKARNVAAEKLKDGDLTNEHLRELIMSELDDIKSNLKGIARKDLLASIDFFEEGLVYLYQVKPNEEDGKRTQLREERAAKPLKQEVGSSEASVKTVSLVEEMRSLQLKDRDSPSARALNDAKDRFKQARQKATEAFCNEALSTSDRILAMQYRIMATILEKVDCVPDALAACRLCLQKLHSMPAVKKSLDVHLQQGFKSRFNKGEREDTIGSVFRMNRVIFYITEIVEEDNDISLWPCIDRGEEKVDPLRDVRVSQTIEKEDPQYFLLKAWPFFREGEETMMFTDWFITTNTKRQLIIVATDGNSEYALLKLFDRNGNLLQSRHLKLPVTERNGVSSPVIRDTASDRSNNVFLLVQRPCLQGVSRSAVTVFDHHANFQHEFDVKDSARGFRIGVSDDDKVFVLAKVEEEKECVQVYNFNGVFLKRVKRSPLATLIDMTSIDPEGDKILVLGSRLDFVFLRFIDYLNEQGNVPSEYNVVSGLINNVYFLHNKEHVAELSFLQDELWLFSKNGAVVRKIKLNLSALIDFPTNTKTITVTTQGLIAMLATEKGTGKRMIVIL